MFNPRHQRSRRSPKGAGVIMMVFIIGFLIIGMIGLFSFEVTRNNTAREELRSAAEAAALAAAAALASSNSTDPNTTHNNALTAAQQAFVINSILGNLLANTTFTDSRNSNAQAARLADPAANEASLYIEFLNKAGTPTAWSDPEGRIIHIIAVFGEEPAFGKYVGIGKANVIYESKARVPSMDIVMCFDVSGSIDDQTKVTFVKRWWDGSRIQYTVTQTGAGLPAQGSIYSCCQPPPTGCTINIEQPQNLNVSYNGMSFSGSQRSASGVDAGSPPGNFPSGTITGDSPQMYTDVVANLDGKDVFAPPYTYVDKNGVSWSFPNLGTVVEAARGNLESGAVFGSSKAAVTLASSGVSPKAGYQAAYFAAAHDLAMPIGAARQAANTFFTLMNNNTDAQFGFISFSSPQPSESVTGVVPNGPFWPIAKNYGTTKINTPYPGVQIGPNNLNTITTQVIPLTRANGGTDIGDAAQMAVNDLINNGRSGSVRAVIFFTDGQPTVGPSWLPAAQQANGAGIAFYTVGLAQNTAIIPAECDNLNDAAGKQVDYIDPLTGSPGSYIPAQAGLSAVSGNGGKFFLVTKKDDLNFVFENIARQLVQISR